MHTHTTTWRVKTVQVRGPTTAEKAQQWDNEKSLENMTTHFWNLQVDNLYYQATPTYEGEAEQLEDLSVTCLNSAKKLCKEHGEGDKEDLTEPTAVRIQKSGFKKYKKLVADSTLQM